MIQNEAVVILHGIGHTKWNMLAVERYLRRQGYWTLNVSYPSRRNNMRALADFLRGRLAVTQIWDRAERVHFVAHSMGGLVTRRYLELNRPQIPANKLGRVVLLAPPSSGSEIADFLRDFPPYKWFFGPAGQELTTSNPSQDIPDAYYDLGIIAGTTSWPYILGSMVLRGPHDGRVSVARTKVAGMKDHIVLSVTHSLIAWKREVHDQIGFFLRTGMFERS